MNDNVHFEDIRIPCVESDSSARHVLWKDVIAVARNQGRLIVMIRSRNLNYCHLNAQMVLPIYAVTSSLACLVARLQKICNPVGVQVHLPTLH